MTNTADTSPRPAYILMAAGSEKADESPPCFFSQSPAPPGRGLACTHQKPGAREHARVGDQPPQAHEVADPPLRRQVGPDTHHDPRHQAIAHTPIPSQSVLHLHHRARRIFSPEQHAAEGEGELGPREGRRSHRQSEDQEGRDHRRLAAELVHQHAADGEKEQVRSR